MDVEQEKPVPSGAVPSFDDVNNARLKWYLGLHSRMLDLVGDYAGSERFLIEGDSLLRHCFEDSKIDFEGEHFLSRDCSSAPDDSLTASAGTDGFQLLHAAYEVERFLESLVRRLCNFHIVFFDSLSS